MSSQFSSFKFYTLSNATAFQTTIILQIYGTYNYTTTKRVKIPLRLRLLVQNNRGNEDAQPHYVAASSTARISLHVVRPFIRGLPWSSKHVGSRKIASTRNLQGLGLEMAAARPGGCFAGPKVCPFTFPSTF